MVNVLWINSDEIPGNGIDDDCDPNTSDSVIDIPDGAYGEQYEGLIPPDATIESYDNNRFAIITGSVKDSTLNPVQGIVVFIHGHSEYGTVQTNSEGVFSIYKSTSTVWASRKCFDLMNTNRKLGNTFKVKTNL